MARKPRIDFEEAFYHVITPGTRGGGFFRSPSPGHTLDAKYGLLPQKIGDSTHLFASKKT
jgi:hypothetical protein